MKPEPELTTAPPFDPNEQVHGEMWDQALVNSPRLNRLSLGTEARQRLVARLHQERAYILRRRWIWFRVLPVATAATLIIGFAGLGWLFSSHANPVTPEQQTVVHTKPQTMSRPLEANICKATKYETNAAGRWERTSLIAMRPDEPSYSFSMTVVRRLDPSSTTLHSSPRSLP